MWSGRGCLRGLRRGATRPDGSRRLGGGQRLGKARGWRSWLCLSIPDRPEFPFQCFHPIEELLDDPVSLLQGLRQGVTRGLGMDDTGVCQGDSGKE